jgi:hypothetical protein
VCKRLGTALRNLVSDRKKRGVTLGGSGRGQLTKNAICKLSLYYYRAVRGNKAAEDIKRAVLASLYHCYSTDQQPTHQYCPSLYHCYSTDQQPAHQYCPSGENSWCFFQQAIARHQMTRPHAKLVHTLLNHSKLHKYLKPVYDRLTEDHLFSGCLSGKTQNANEPLNSIIWSRWTKDNFALRS